jgi:hypothetical protein
MTTTGEDARARSQMDRQAAWSNSKPGSVSSSLFLRAGEIDMILTPQRVWDPLLVIPRPEFSGFPLRQQGLSRRVLQANPTATRLRKAVAHEDSSCCIGTWSPSFDLDTCSTDHQGEPRWQGSEAERFLKLDVAENEHHLMNLTALRLTCRVPQSILLEVFENIFNKKFAFEKLSETSIRVAVENFC